MSQEWVELVRAGFEAAARGDLEAFEEGMTPDVEIIQPPFTREQALEAATA